MLVCKLVDETIDRRLWWACTRLWHSPLVRCRERVHNETGAFECAILAGVTLKVHLLKLFGQTSLLDHSELLACLVAFTAFSLRCGCKVVVTDACWSDGLLSLLFKITGTGLYNVLGGFHFLNFYLRLTRDLEVLGVIIGCTQKWVRDYFFKTTVDGGDCLLSRGVNLRFRLLSCWNNLIPAILVLVIV